MEIVYCVAGLDDYLRAQRPPTPGSAIFLDRFLEDAIEVDVDALVRRERRLDRRDHAARRGGRASTRATPPACCRRTRSATRCSTQIRAQTEGIARALEVVGLLNVQFAVRDERLYVIEANPRASRTVPFVVQGDRAAARQARLPGHARRAARRPRPAGGHDATAMCASRRSCSRSTASPAPTRCSGPEMRSTGEVMGIARDFPTAFAKAQAAAGAQLPSGGHGVHHRDRRRQAGRDRRRATLHDLGFEIVATRGTAQAIRTMGIPAERDQQDRRGLAARRRLDRARRGRPRDQHARRHRRARRRLGDPVAPRSPAESRASRR